MLVSQQTQITFQKKQPKDNDNIRSTKVSQNIRSSQLSQKLKFKRFSTQTDKKSSTNSPQKQNPIDSIYTQLHQYIATVDEKITYLLQKQSNQYKVVYQHYYKKFKDELNQLKEKTLQQQKKYLKNQHVTFIESEIKILREQVVAYKNSCQKLKKQNDELKEAVDFLKQDINFLENNVKNRIKQIKLLTTQNAQLQAQISRQNFNETQRSEIKAFTNQKEFKKRSHSMNIESLSQPQIKVQFHKYKPNPIHKQLSSNRNIYEEYLMTNKSTTQKKTASFRSLIEKSSHSIKDKINYAENLPLSSKSSKDKKYFRTQSSQKAEKSSKLFDICDWFLNCVNTVKKQIFHRKLQNNSFQRDRINNEFMYFDSLNDFKKLDKLQLLEIFLSSEEIMSMMYHLLKNQKKLKMEDLQQTGSILSQKNVENKDSDLKHQKSEDFESRFTNLELRKNTTKQRHNKTMTQLGFFDWSLVEKAHKFQNLSQFNKTAAINPANQTTFSKSISKISKKDQNQKISIQYQQRSFKKIEEQKNIKMMKKITAIMNKKKSIPLSSQLFARKKNFIIQ